MKKLLVITAFILLSGVAFGQTLKKGNCIDTHVFTVELAPGVTMDQYLDFRLNKFVPEWEKHFKGGRQFLLKGIRGENENEFALLFYFESEEIKVKYINDDKSLTKEGEAAIEKISSVREELLKLGTKTGEYTDWIIQ
jgi:hypothetical protein